MMNINVWDELNRLLWYLLAGMEPGLDEGGQLLKLKYLINIFASNFI